jgi:hypothetical protein
MNYEDFILGGQISAATFATQMFISKEYTEGNFQLQKMIKRAICLGYAFGLALIAMGAGNFGDEWWVTGLSFISGMLAFGALLEAFKKIPLAPKDQP